MKEKKPLYKRWWFWVIVVLLCIGAFRPSSNTDNAARLVPASSDSATKRTISSAASESAPAATPSPDPSERPQPEVTAEPTPTATPEPTQAPEPTEAPTPTPIPERDYVINTSTLKFHKPGCSSVDDIDEGNRWDYHGTYQSVVDMGYTPCKRCNPF